MRAGRPDRTDLGRFNNGVAVLRQDTVVVGHLTTVLDSFRNLFLVRQQRVWLLVTWLDGTHERIQEDYPPWSSVAELLQGHLTWDRNGREEVLDVEWLSGHEHDRAWRDFGIHEAVEAYM